MVLPPLVLVPGKLAVNPLPRASGIISASLFPYPQACSRLSIFSATHPQQTETAHASLHARDPAQPYDARIFCCPDASKCSSLPPSLAPFEKGRETELLDAWGESGRWIESWAVCKWLWGPAGPSQASCWLSYSSVLPWWGTGSPPHWWQVNLPHPGNRICSETCFMTTPKSTLGLFTECP